MEGKNSGMCGILSTKEARHKKMIRTESFDDDSERKRQRNTKKKEKVYKGKSDFSIPFTLKQVYCTVMTHFLLPALLKETTFFLLFCHFILYIFFIFNIFNLFFLVTFYLSFSIADLFLVIENS